MNKMEDELTKVAIALFIKKSAIPELETCKIERIVRRGVPTLVIDCPNLETTKFMYKRFRFLSTTARQCGFHGHLIFHENGEPASAISRLSDF